MSKTIKDDQTPVSFDSHTNKKRLLQKGLERGFLNKSEIERTLPKEMMTDVEYEVFAFTCENLGIKIRDY